MKIIHKKSTQDPTRGTMTSDVWYYQTEVLNDAAVPVRVIWFEFYYSHDGQWYGINKKNKVLQHEDFRAWYSDGEKSAKDAWIQPGQAWVCDPNWHMDIGHGFYDAKWAYLAVDKHSETYFAEAVVPEDATQHFEFG